MAELHKHYSHCTWLKFGVMGALEVGALEVEHVNVYLKVSNKFKEFSLLCYLEWYRRNMFCNAQTCLIFLEKADISICEVFSGDLCWILVPLNVYIKLNYRRLNGYF